MTEAEAKIVLGECMCDKCYSKKCDIKCDYAKAHDVAIKAIDQVAKTGRWIPCSERLPEKGGQYLVTRVPKTCGNLWNRVYIVNYSDLMGLRKERIWWSGNVGKIDFESYDDVLAWMPLPEPYKAEMESEE